MTVEILYGRHAVHETLRAGRRPLYTLNLTANLQDAGLVRKIRELASQASCRVQRVDKQQFDRMLSGVNHQGVALEVGPYPYVSLDDPLDLAKRRGEAALLLLLDHLQDPQNLGTLLRTAEAMGVHGVIIPKRRAASITPAVCNASSGAVEHLLVAQVTNLARTQDDLKGRGVWIAGLASAAPQGHAIVQTLAESDWSGALALVVGGEGQGLSRLVREKCDWLVHIPLAGQVGSLNAAVAGSVALVAARQARQARQAT